MVVSAATTEDLEITPEEFSERYPNGTQLSAINLFELLRKANPGAMNRISEVLQSQCMHVYCVDYVLGKAKFSSETDAIT